MNRCGLKFLFVGGADVSIEADKWTSYEIKADIRAIIVKKNEVITFIAPIDNLLCVYPTKEGETNG